MPSKAQLEKKGQYFDKLTKYFTDFSKVIIVGCNNVGSNHMQKIRQSLRGEATVLLGKKTMMRKAIRNHLEQNPDLESLIPHLHGNIGFIFTNGDLTEVRNKVVGFKVNAPAKANTVAPNDVQVPAGPTGLEPTQTSFLQALNIATKINKGQIEILSPVTLLKAGEKVGASEATLLAKLNIRPFLYGLVPLVVYDSGLVYDQRVLDMGDEEIFTRLRKGLANIAAVGLDIGFPTPASVPHSIIRGFKNLLSIAVETEYNFPKADTIKELIANPEAAAAAAAAAMAAAAPAQETKKEEAVKEEEKPVEEEDEDADMGLDLFG